MTMRVVEENRDIIKGIKLRGILPLAEGMGKASSERIGMEEKRRETELDIEKLKSLKHGMGELKEIESRRQEHEKRKKELKERMAVLEKK